MANVLSKITGVFMTVITFLASVLGPIACFTETDSIFAYTKHIENSSIYDCAVEDAISQADLCGKVSGHFNELLKGGKLSKKCLMVGYDGARADVVDFRADHGAINYVSDMGSCVLSYAGGTNIPLPNIQNTSTAPGWASILTGQSALKNGVTGNGVSLKEDSHSLVYSLIDSGAADKTSFFTSWTGHFVDENSTYGAEMRLAAEKGYNANYVCLENDEAVINAAIAELLDPNGSDFVLVILEGPDHAGHTSGFSYFNQDYQKAFTQTDKDAMRIVSAVAARYEYNIEDWLIILTSDHGGIRTGHGGISMQERLTFVASNK